jgi:signal transduction histidine kinase
MNIDLVILVTSGAASMLLAALVMIRNAKAKINQIFGLFAGSIVLWAISNYFADNGPADVTLFFTRLTFALGVPIAYAAVLLSANFPKEGLSRHKDVSLVLLYASMLFVAIICFTPYMVPDATKGLRGAQIETGPLYLSYLVMVVAVLVRVVSNFKRQYKNATFVQKRQIYLIILSILLYALFAVLSNIIIPFLINDWASSRFGPLSALITVAIIGYAIIRHGLFDIRLVIVRSLAYLQVLLVVALIYGFIVLGIASLTFDVTIPASTQILLSLATGFSVLLFPYLKRGIDRLTNKLLYRDAYDPEIFFKDINQILVTNTNLAKLAKSVGEVVEKNLKSEYCNIVLKSGDGHTARILGSTERVGKQSLDIHHIEMLVAQHRQEVIVTDALQAQDHELRTLLQKNGIAMLVRLGNQDQPVENLGYIAFGPKKSGNQYNSQDVKVVDAMSDALAIGIQNALRFDEIQRFNQTLQAKVEEATRKLRHSNDKLRALDQTKDDFISMASHQLRTPLTSVKGYVSMVLDGDAGKITPLQRKLLNQSFVSSQRMVYLISDLLNVSRLRTGKFVIEPTPTNLAAVIEGELAQLLETAKSRNLELVYDKPDNFPTYLFDETKLRQVIMNFVDNAIYYTPSGGKIVVSLVERPQTIEFTVTDNGMGVPKQDQPHLFTKFFRAHNARRARPDGTGLGLFMAKKVVIAQGGAIIFKSQEGKGSMFGFSFAKKHLHLPPESAQQHP